MKPTHKDFKVDVETVLTRRTRAELSHNEYFVERIRLTKIGLAQIAYGGHGPTWAKTLLKLYGE